MSDNHDGVGLKQDLVDLSIDIDAILNEFTTSFIACAKKRVVDENLSHLTALMFNKTDTFKKMIRRVNTEYAEEEKIAKLEEKLSKRDALLTSKCEMLSECFQDVSDVIFKGQKAFNSAKADTNESLYPDEILEYSHLISKNFSVAAPHFWQQGDPMRPFPTDMQFRFSALMASSGLSDPSELKEEPSTSAEEVDEKPDKTMIDFNLRDLRTNDLPQLNDYSVEKDLLSTTKDISDLSVSGNATTNKKPANSGYDIGVMSSDEDSEDSD